jgi:hypothetical protein
MREFENKNWFYRLLKCFLNSNFGYFVFHFSRDICKKHSFSWIPLKTKPKNMNKWNIPWLTTIWMQNMNRNKIEKSFLISFYIKEKNIFQYCLSFIFSQRRVSNFFLSIYKIFSPFIYTAYEINRKLLNYFFSII